MGIPHFLYPFISGHSGHFSFLASRMVFSKTNHMSLPCLKPFHGPHHIKMKLAATDCKILDEDVPPSLANLSCLAHCLLQVSFSLSFLPGCLLPLRTPLQHALLKSAGLNPHNDMDMPLSFMLPCPLRGQKQGAKELLQGCPWPERPCWPSLPRPCPALLLGLEASPPGKGACPWDTQPSSTSKVQSCLPRPGSKD